MAEINIPHYKKPLVGYDVFGVPFSHYTVLHLVKTLMEAPQSFTATSGEGYRVPRIAFSKLKLPFVSP